MLYIAIAILGLGGMTLYGFIRWLDRVHPDVKPDDARLVKLEGIVESLKDEMTGIKLGRR